MAAGNRPAQNSAAPVPARMTGENKGMVMWAIDRCDCCDKPLNGGYRVMFDRSGDEERICIDCYSREMEPPPLDAFDKVCITLLSVAFAALIVAQFLEV